MLHKIAITVALVAILIVGGWAPYWIRQIKCKGCGQPVFSVQTGVWILLLSLFIFGFMFSMTWRN